MYYWNYGIEGVKMFACPYCFESYYMNRKCSCIDIRSSKNPSKEILISDDVIFSPSKYLLIG